MHVHKIVQKQNSPRNLMCGRWKSSLFRYHHIRHTTSMMTRRETEIFFPKIGILYLPGKLFKGMNKIIKNSSHSSNFLNLPCMTLPPLHYSSYAKITNWLCAYDPPISTSANSCIIITDNHAVKLSTRKQNFISNKPSVHPAFFHAL